MKTNKLKIFLCTLLFMCFLSGVAYSESGFYEIAEKTGELSYMLGDAMDGNVDFSDIWAFLKEKFFGGIIELKETFVVLMCVSLMASLIECITIEKHTSAAVRIGISAVCILVSSDKVTSFFEITKNAVGEISDFMFMAFVYMSSLLFSSGKTLTASKATLISLGSANILTYLIENIFIPLSYLYYVLVVASSIIENDIFKSIKKTIIWSIKIVLPFFVGLYTTVLSLFVKASSESDEFFLKTAKTVLSSTIPFLGNVLNSSADTVLESLSIIKSQSGFLVTLALVAILASPLLKLLSGMLLFKLLGIVSGFTGNSKAGAFFEELSVAISFLAGMAGTMAVVTIISIIALMG